MTRGRRRSVAVLGYSFAAVMLGGTVPTPLYHFYVRTLGLSPLLVTVIFAAYAVGTLAALLLGGGLSDRVGRRPVLGVAVALSAVSCGVFALWQALPGLLLGRVLSGLSVGLTTGTATAALTEVHPSRRTATTLATVANMGGLGLGPALAGAIAQHLPAPTTTPYLVLLALLVPTAALATIPESAPSTVSGPAALLRAIRPQRLAVPRGRARPFLAAALSGFTAFALLGLFTSLTSSFLTQSVGDPGPQVVGLTVSLTFAASVTAQLLVRRMDLTRAGLIGLAAMPVGAGLVVGALTAGSLPLFLGGAAVGGVGIGFAFQSGVARVGLLAAAADRAAVTSSFFVGAYLGITLPVVGMGALATATSLEVAALGLAVLVSALAAVAALLTLGTPADERPQARGSEESARAA